MNLALFDMDGTLLPIDTNQSFGRFLIRHGWIEGQAWERTNSEFMAAHDRGDLDLDRYIDFSTASWRDRPPAEAHALLTAFVNEVIAPAIPAAAMTLVQSHRQRGDLIALVTGTNEFLAEPIAALLGIEHVLAVQLERDAAGKVTGRIAGIPSFAAGKVDRVHHWLADLSLSLRGFERVSFYGDSVNDIPLLELATHPVAVNPSAALEAVAVERGWRVVRL